MRLRRCAPSALLLSLALASRLASAEPEKRKEAVAEPGGGKPAAAKKAPEAKKAGAETKSEDPKKAPAEPGTGKGSGDSAKSSEPKKASESGQAKPSNEPSETKKAAPTAPSAKDDTKKAPEPSAASAEKKSAAEKPAARAASKKTERDEATAPAPRSGGSAPAKAPSPEPSGDAEPPLDDAVPGSLPEVTRGGGARSVAPPASSASEVEKPPEKSPEKSSSKPGKETAAAHRKGPAPKKPSPTLPEGVAPRAPDTSARRVIAGGATADDVRRGKDDAELRTLAEAERVLFPRPLPGVELGFSWPVTTDADGPEVDASGLPPGVTAAARPRAGVSEADAAWLRSLTPPNLPVRYDERVVRYLKFYRDTPSGRSIARTWAKKSGRYSPALREKLAAAGLPSDLVWLSLIESGHNPTISSPVGAAGLWQFMPDAGRSYGLTVDRWVDERLDPERSTEAAIRYLSDLYRRFASWDLSMAAYNMGYGGLARSIRKFNTNSFWELSRYEAGIPWETTLYVPKILATAVLMANKRAFGIDSVPEDPPERFDVVSVGPSVPLEEIARAASTELSSIEALNPQLLAGRTPPLPPASRGSFRVRVPKGKGEQVSRALAKLPSDDGLEVYVVKAGDTVERIALARGASERELREKNRVGSDEALSPGTLLLVPKREAADPDPTSREEVVVVPARELTYPDRKRVFYRVVGGDTPAKIAASFGVSEADLETWNALDLQARLEPGMTLQVFVDKRANLSKVVYVPEAHAKVLVAGSPEFCEYFEGQNGRTRLVIAAREGDTLASIGKRYGMTPGQMERINRRGRTDPLLNGEQIVVYTDKGRLSPGDSLFDAERRASSATE